jgi:hypothetical protein
MFPVQHTAYFSEEMWTHLHQIARKRADGTTANDLLREAARMLIENEADVLGSRRHFQNTLQQRVDRLEDELVTATLHSNGVIVFYLHTIIQMLALGLAHLLSSSGKVQVSPQQLIQKAVIQARKEEDVFAAQIAAVREMSLTEQKR